MAHYRSFHSWEEICYREELEKKTVDEKKLKFLLFVYSTHKQLHNDVGLDGNAYVKQGQAALTAVTDVIKESVWFIIVYCFFTVGSVTYTQIYFL